MDARFYSFLHFLGMAMVFLAYGGLIVRTLCGVDSKPIRRIGAMTSGIGLVLLLVGGFGLQARLDLGWPVWILLKIGIWVLLGSLIVHINRRADRAQLLWWITLLLGMAAMLLGLFKPTW